MNLLQAIRKRRRRWVSQVMGLLGVVWLSMVLQPCLMAADMGGMDGMGGDCPHCPTPMTQGCGSSGECTYIDRVDYDGRTPHVKPANDLPDQNPELFGALATPIPLPGEVCATGPPSGAGPDLPTPPLNILFCVYLN